MNEQRRPARNAAAVTITADFNAGRRARGETPLQTAIGAMRHAFRDARGELDERTYGAFVDITLRLAMREAQRLTVAEAARAVKEAA